MNESKTGLPERERTPYRIEHFPDCDVLINLDTNPEDWTKLLTILKQLPNTQARAQISEIKDEAGEKVFYVKHKSIANRALKYLKENAITNDPVIYGDRVAVDDLNTRQSVFGITNTVNEINIANKINKIISSEEAQNIVRKRGFLGISFALPIVAITNKITQEKYIVYKKIEEKMKNPVLPITTDMTQELRELFIAQGVNPHDLRQRQFIKTPQNTVVLIDVEAYTAE